MATKAHLDGNKRYLEKLDHITIRLPKGEKDTIKAHADSIGMSVNAFIVQAINSATKVQD